MKIRCVGGERGGYRKKKRLNETGGKITNGRLHHVIRALIKMHHTSDTVDETRLALLVQP